MFRSGLQLLFVSTIILGIASLIPMTTRREVNAQPPNIGPQFFRPGFPQRTTPPQMISGNPNLQSFGGGQGGGMMGMVA